MGSEISFRPATPDDALRIAEIIAAARERMRLRGSLQWQGAYPAPEDIARDIAAGDEYVLEEGGGVLAYGAVVFRGEPAYASIDGAWLNDNPYVVVHRLAVARGVCDFRVDTNFDNLQMQKILSRLGFTLCGEIMYGGDKRLAYQKML